MTGRAFLVTTGGSSFSRHLALSLREGLDFSSTRGTILLPSAAIYRSIFAWDAGWHYYWLRHLDPHRAREEMTTLLSTRYSDGRIPHETPLDDAGSPRSRRLVLWLLRHSFDEEGNSWYIDPPVYLSAALDAAEGCNDKIKKKIITAVEKKLAWLKKHRCFPSAPEPFDRFPVIMHPLESGTDFSPSFDEVWGGPPLLMLRSITLLKKIAAGQWSLAGGGETDFPLVYDLTFLTLYFQALGDYERAAGALEKKSRALQEVFFAATFDREALLFRQYFLRRGRLQKTGRVTFSSLLPCLLYHEGSENRFCRQAVEEHCLPGKSFWRGELPAFNPEKKSCRSRLLWRGSCSWMNMNYMLFKILLMYGFHDEAKLIHRRAAAAVERIGPWEYLDAFGEGGGGASFFSWNGLLLAMEKELLTG